MEDTQQIDIKKRRGKRQTLLIMVAVFALPYAVAWLLYFNPGLVELGTRSNGILLSPVITPDQYQITDAKGTSFSPNKNKKQWTLMTFGSSKCEDTCKKNLFVFKQVRRMMAVDRAYISRAYIMLDTTNPESINKEIAKFIGTNLYQLSTDNAKLLEAKIGVEVGQLAKHFVIADPHGNLIMTYAQNKDPKKIFHDIEILFGRVKGI